jgi:hypothetical protein
MDVREKLVELIFKSLCRHIHKSCKLAESIADDLIADGVTVQELDGCFRCKDTSEMTVTISNKLVAGVRTGWLGGNLPARYCPFCGRRLPQPPKGE